MVQFAPGSIPGLVHIQPTIFTDERGLFYESYNTQVYKDAGIDCIFVQDNESVSRKGVFRGLHFQINHPQAKLVRVSHGAVLDIIVDLRKDSPTFQKYISVYLSADSKQQLYIPRGCAHGFVALEDNTYFLYKCDEYYHPEDEGGILWNDKTIGIDWDVLLDTYDISELIVSEKDQQYIPLHEQNIQFVL